MNTTTQYHLPGMGQSGAQIGHSVAGGILSSASQYFRAASTGRAAGGEVGHWLGDRVGRLEQVQATSPAAALTSLAIDPMLVLIGGLVLLLAVLI
jgi:hypothetical protein